jgi:hypothetical protein
VAGLDLTRVEQCGEVGSRGARWVEQREEAEGEPGRDAVVGEVDAQGCATGGVSLQNAATLAASAGVGIVLLGSSFCRCRSICSSCWR